MTPIDELSDDLPTWVTVGVYILLIVTIPIWLPIGAIGAWRDYRKRVWK